MTFRKVEFVGQAARQVKTWETAKNRKTQDLFAKLLIGIFKIEYTEKVSSKYFKKIVGLKKSWEIRLSFCGESHRFYGMYRNGTLVIMKYYLSKKTRKTPQNIIKSLKKDEKMNK